MSLQTELAELNKQALLISDRKAALKATAVTEVQKLMKDYGITLKDVREAVRKPRKEKKNGPVTVTKADGSVNVVPATK